MDRRGGLALVFSLVVLAILIAGMFAFVSYYKPVDKQELIKRAISNVSGIRSPIAGLSSKQIESGFNESSVYSLLTEMNAGSLHNIPLGRELPKIKIVVDKEIFSASVNRGKIIVKKADVSSPDIIITTTRREAAQMATNGRYISTSFKNGKSSLELVADRATLIAKGYVSLYTKVTGTSFE